MPSTPAIVQTWSEQNTTHATTITLPTPGTSPTVGNLVVVFLATIPETVTAPSGWTELTSVTCAGNIELWVGTGIVQSGDTGAYVFSVPSEGLVLGCSAYEVSGAAASPIAASNVASANGSTTCTVSASATGANQLPLAGAAITAGSNHAASYTVSSPWTLDWNLNSVSEANMGSAHNALTSGSGSVSVTWTNAATGLIQPTAAIVLIQGTAPPPPPSQGQMLDFLL